MTDLPLLPTEARMTIRPRIARRFLGGTVAIDGSVLEIFDGARARIGEETLAGTAVSLEVIGDKAFVGTSSCLRADIHAIDLSEPTAPRVVARWSLLELKRDDATLSIVGQASDELVLLGRRSIAFVDVSAPEAPRVERLVPWPFGEQGWAWDIDVNEEFLVVAGIDEGDNRPRAYVYSFGSDVPKTLDIAQESTPVLEDNLLVVATPDRGVVVLRLDALDPPQQVAELPLPFLDWMPAQHAGFAFLRDNFVVDLRDAELGIYRPQGSADRDCVIRLLAESVEDSSVDIAPFLAPDERFEPGTVVGHDCGRPQLNGIVIESTGAQAIVNTLDPSPLRVTPDRVQPDSLSVEGQIIAWVGDRMVTRQTEGFDFGLTRKDTFRVYADDGQGTLIAEIPAPGSVRDMAVKESIVAILVEPKERAYDEPPSPVVDWRILTLNFAAASPSLTPVDKPETLSITRIAIDEAAVFGLSAQGELYRWPLDGQAATKGPFVAGEVGQLVATRFGVFASTANGWLHTDGSSVRQVVLPGQMVSLVAADNTYVYWHLKRGQAFIGPTDDHIVLTRPVASDSLMEMTPEYGIRVWNGTSFVAGQSIVAGWPGLVFYSRPW